jgi:hypothetical protein
MTHEELQATVTSMAEQLGTQLTLGYIGNRSPSTDDRSWSIWFSSLPRGLGERSPSNLPSLWIGDTKEVERLNNEAVREMIARRWIRLNQLLEDQS